MEIVKKVGSPVLVFLRRYKTQLVLGSLVCCFLAIPIICEAQSGLKIQDFDQIKEKAKEGTDPVSDVAKYAIGGALAVALVFVVWAVATNQPHGKEFALGWFIAVVIVLIGFLVV